MITPRIACVIGSAIVASTLHAQSFNDDFEAYQAGPVPIGDWMDVFDRVGIPTVPAPTAFLIDTTDAHGNPTKAIQTVRAFRSASGVYKAVAHSDHHSLTIDVRVDRFANPGQGWPIGVGFAQDAGFDDVNQNPHAVIYAWTNRRWNLFISQGIDNPTVNIIIPTPLIVIGNWYALTVEAMGDQGMFIGTVADAQSGEVLGTTTHQIANWDPARGIYDAILVFDGETPGALSFGQGSVDNIIYNSSAQNGCDADLNGDGLLNFSDVSSFLASFSKQDPLVDFLNDGNFNFLDVSAFLDLYGKGCP